MVNKDKTKIHERKNMKQTFCIIAASLILLGCATTGIPYPLDTCIVSENKLDSMGKPVRIVHEGQEIKFCCKPCIKKFKKDPAKYLVRLKK